MEKLGLNVGYILVQIIAFLLLVVVLNAWVYKPLMTLLQKRREKIAASLEDARVASEARASAERPAATEIVIVSSSRPGTDFSSRRRPLRIPSGSRPHCRAISSALIRLRGTYAPYPTIPAMASPHGDG